MTTPAPRDLTAIVEKVARSEYERACELTANIHPLAVANDTWDEAGPLVKHAWRERVLPIVVATIRALDEGDEL